jgi:hypothetical protein
MARPWLAWGREAGPARDGGGAGLAFIVRRAGAASILLLLLLLLLLHGRGFETLKGI